MPRKATTLSLEDAVAAYVAGESAQRVGPCFGVCAKRLTAELKERGLFRSVADGKRLGVRKATRTRHAERGLPDDEIARRYALGESENVLARAFGVNRITIAAALRNAGVTRRTLAQSLTLAKSALPLKERRSLWADRQGDRQTPLDARIADAQRRERIAAEGKRVHMAQAEITLADWLRDRGLQVTPQQAVGPYNVDIGADPVAVEVWGGSWHFHRDHRDRIGHLLDGGWHLVIVFADQRTSPLTIDVAEHIIALTEQARREPSLRGQYRVVWGNGEVFATGDREHDNFTRIVPRRTRHGRGA